MTVVYVETTVSNIDETCELLVKQDIEMSKLLVEIVGNVHGVPVIREGTSSKIYQLYIKFAQAKPNTNVQINIENLKGRRAVRRSDVRQLVLNEGLSSPSASLPASGDLLKMFRNVVLGGTFDRLHVGHKILLTEAVLRCESKLTVGVTDESMIQNKKLWELIEPVEERIANVLDFLKYVDGGLQYDVVPISDMYGPTRTDPDLDLLVVSAETEKGGHKVNEERLARGMAPMVLHTVPLVQSHSTGEADELKMSSSNGRLRLLGIKLRQPESKPKLAERPYLIGLTGGIASGKSSIARRLGEKGAGVVDCDQVAHALYRKGTPTYSALVEMFGPNVVSQDGEVDRKALGAIVFNSEEQMDKLNKLLWPAILEASLAEAQRLYQEEKKEVVVLEAAVLLRAGWHNSVHEVWTCIVPANEAVDRVVKRNGVAESAAKARLAAQPSNSEQVAIAHVVFCSLYSYDYTGSQVDRAWASLQASLSNHSKLSTKL